MRPRRGFRPGHLGGRLLTQSRVVRAGVDALSCRTASVSRPVTDGSEVSPHSEAGLLPYSVWRESRTSSLAARRAGHAAAMTPTKAARATKTAVRLHGMTTR